MKLNVAVILCLLFCQFSFGQYFTNDVLFEQIPSYEIDSDGDFAVFSTFYNDSTTLHIFDLNTFELKKSKKVEWFILAPFIHRYTVYMLHLFREENGTIHLEMNKLDTNLNVQGTFSFPNLDFFNFNILSKPFFVGNDLIYAGNVWDSIYLRGYGLMRFDTLNNTFSLNYFDDYGIFYGNGFTKYGDDFLVWGNPVDSSSLGADLMLFRLNDSLEILDTTLLGDIDNRFEPSVGSQIIESIGAAHEQFTAISNDTILLSGTSRSNIFSLPYSVTNTFLSYVDLESGEYINAQSIGSLDSNGFGMFSQPFECPDGQFGYLSTEGTSNSFGFIETSDSYISFYKFNKNLDLLSEKTFFKGDKVYQRFHSAVLTDNDEIIGYGSEYSLSKGLKTFLFKMDCDGALLSVNYLEPNKSQLYFFPNPSNDVFYCSSENVMQIKAFNMAGSLVKTSDVNRIDLHGFPPGLYFLETITSEKVEVKRVVLN